MRVLVVDDEPLFVEMVDAMLAGEDGIEVVGRAHDGRTAVELARSLQPDVTLMDISMPGMDGIEATARIRAVSPTACILILTGADVASEIDRARKAGAAGFLTKDAIHTELVDRIRELGG